MMNFKIGDRVRCKPGYNKQEAFRHDLGGGRGYNAHFEFVIENITEVSQTNVKTGLPEKFTILWPESGHGVYAQVVENVTGIEDIVKDIDNELNIN